MLNPLQKKMFWDKISFSILLLVTFLTPIFFLPSNLTSTQFGTSLLFGFGTILAVLIYIISTIITGKTDLPRPSRYIVLFLLIVPIAYTLAGIANGFSRMSFFGYTFDISTVGFILLCFAYMFLVSVLFKEKGKILYSYFAFVVSSLLLSLFLLARIIFGANFLSFGIFTQLISTSLGAWNNVGIFFGIGVILSLLAHEMIKGGRFMKGLFSLALVLCLFFLALVNFTAIWVTIAVSSFLFTLYRLFSARAENFVGVSLKNKLLSVPLYPFIVILISIVFVIWGNSVGNFLSSSLQISNLEVRPTLGTTLDIARNTIRERPLFGSGSNNFTTQWLTWKPSDVVSSVYWNTDFSNGIGLIPTFAVTTGLVGIISWLLFLGFYLYLGVKSIFLRVEDLLVKYFLVSSFFISLYLWIMAFLYVPSAVILILTFFFTGLFFASVYSAGLYRIETWTFSENPRAGFVSSLVLVLLFFGSSWIGYGLIKSAESVFNFQKSSYALNVSGDIQKSEDFMMKAIAAVPNDVYYRALSEIEIIKLNAVVSQDPQVVKLEDIQKQFSDVLSNAIKAGLAAKDSDPLNYLNWVALGRVYESVSAPELKIQGMYESAQIAYTEALRRNPKNPAILIVLSRLAVSQKNLNLARQYAFQAIELKRNYIDAYFILSQIEVADNNIKGAIESVAAASVIDPTNAGVFFQLGLLKYNIKDFNGAVVALEKAKEIVSNYANAKYFLGLSYDQVGERTKAITEFEDLLVTNPESIEVKTILENLKAGRSALTDTSTKTPEKGKTLPVSEN